MSTFKKMVMMNAILVFVVIGCAFFFYYLANGYDAKIRAKASEPMINTIGNKLKDEKDLYEKIKAHDYIRTLIVGDSIGDGTGAKNTSEKWFYRLSAALENEYKVTNFITNLSRGGASVLGGWTDYNLKNNTIKDKYDLAFICFGQNDQGVLPLEIYSSLYERLIKQIKEEKGNPEIFLIIENGVATKGYPEAIIQLAQKYELDILDTRLAFKQSGYTEADLTIDTVHPSSLGHEIYYKSIMDVIHTNLQHDKKVNYSATAAPLFVKSDEYKTFHFTNTYSQINGFSSAQGNSTGTEKGNTLEATVHGSAIGLMLMQTPIGGKFDVYIDGHFIKELDNYSPFQNINTFIIGDQFSNGPHKVSIQINGKKSPESKRTLVELLGFVSNRES